MSGPRVGTQDFLHSKGVVAYANIPIQVILRAMAPDQCLDSRLRHAMILWSWCGPEPNEFVVRKKHDGYIVRDNDGKPIAAQLKDLLSLLGLAPGMKGHVSRTAQWMVEQDLLRFEGKVMYLVFKPSAFDPKKSEKSVAMHGNLNIAGVAVHGNWLPDDPVARQDVIRFIEGLHAQWKTERNQANARARELLRTGLLERGISIERSSRSLGVKREEPAAANLLQVEEEHSTSEPNPPPPALPPETLNETHTVLVELQKFVTAAPDAARTLIAKCREFASDAPVSAICHFIGLKVR